MVDHVVADRKAQLRATLLASRRAVPAPVRSAEASALAAHAEDAVDTGDTVCAYVPVRSEPGSPELLERLRDRCARLLLPIVCMDAGEPVPLRWGAYVPGELAAGRFGLLEPTGPALPPTALADAAVVFVPALAVDRHGVRLGRGGGFYDRSLIYRADDCKLVAVVRDSEIVETLPGDAHDIHMSHALSPHRGLTILNAPDNTV
ncbi:MAG: 5-formyltetrahydrofolate cyclo-ligase [Mycobacterium sp.]